MIVVSPCIVNRKKNALKVAMANGNLTIDQSESDGRRRKSILGSKFIKVRLSGRFGERRPGCSYWKVA